MSAIGRSGDDEGIIEVEGARLRYVAEGQGQPCIVVGTSVFYAREFSRSLREHLRLIFVDLRHFAASDPSFGPERVSIDTYAEDIEQVRRTLGLGDVVVIGHSIHGAIALEYARRYPGHVRGVVAIGARARISAEDWAEEDRLWQDEASAEQKQIVADRVAQLTPELRAALSPEAFWVRDFLAYGPQQWLDPSYDAAWLWEGVVPNIPLLDRLYGELFDPYDLAQGPSAITVPVLVANGRHDFYAPRTIWAANRHKLPQHTLVEFEGSAHTPQLEVPAQFDQALLDWIDELPPRP